MKDAETTAAAHSLSVGSNKSLIGSGKTTGIKGIGLDLRGVENVIIQVGSFLVHK